MFMINNLRKRGPCPADASVSSSLKAKPPSKVRLVNGPVSRNQNWFEVCVAGPDLQILSKLHGGAAGVEAGCGADRGSVLGSGSVTLPLRR